MLYWFRTPPGIKVGRAALDEDAIRQLEELNPDVEFDWTRMLKAELPPPEPRLPALSSSRPQPQQKRREGSQPRRERDGERRRERRTALPPSVEPQVEPPIEPAIDRDESVIEPGTLEEVSSEPLDVNDLAGPVAIVPDEVAEPPSLMPSAAQARLGTEGIVRLRGRHAEVLARIDERIADAVRREELKQQAERLNPDSWVTDDEVRAGLEQYEAVFDSLRAVVGRRRRRRRRRGGRPQPETPVMGTEAQDVDEAADSGESDDL